MALSEAGAEAAADCSAWRVPSGYTLMREDAETPSKNSRRLRSCVPMAAGSYIRYVGGGTLRREGDITSSVGATRRERSARSEMLGKAQAFRRFDLRALLQRGRLPWFAFLILRLLAIGRASGL